MKQRVLTLKAVKRLSSGVLYALVSLAAAVFGLVFLVGFDMPSASNPELSEPLLTNVLLVFTYLVAFIALAVGAWALVKSAANGSGSASIVNGINVKRLTRGMIIGVPCGFILFYITGSTVPLNVNGTPFNNAFWLKTSDMFIHLSLLLLAVGIAAAVWAGFKNYRRN